ncbi:protein HAPLESS 2-A-like [Panicum virgatum]|uniref:Generative cell specific-1/HAP2 domain-containing protein n=1 Tax=Panicum virgatum TaxID=38727 RepID=A0A8T0V116_PANVG|nr:protein HAPLESS 2-A-like [Panicum virgatum]KAG2628127.1 hypothetical protein PVAP13_3KG228645 [Panicum virgatum]
MPPPRAVLPALLLAALLASPGVAGGAEVLAKSRLELCERDSGAGGRLSCAQKLVLNVAIPSGSSGGEASLVTKVVDVVNGTEPSRSLRDPPVITISKSSVAAVYKLTYMHDVAYKPEEHYVETRKCEPDAGANVVGYCERLWNADGTVTPHTEPVCCPCGPNQRAPSSCGNIFDKITKGKRNTAHCLRFTSDWFHVWGVGDRSRAFSIRVQVKKGSSVSEVVVGPENKTVVSSDNFLKVNLVGEYGNYNSMPTFEGMNLVTPRKGAGSGQPQDLGDEHSKWMLLEKVRFGPGCNKIGVGYEAFQYQSSFCSSSLSSCLNDQLWNFWESDKSRIDMNLVPEHIVEGRFQRINQHQNAGAHTFSVGVTEAIASNLLLELSADDIQYFYQRSPGKIMDIRVSTFEALSQVGVAKINTKNIGELEASYRLTFNCVPGIGNLEEQYYVMKPGEVVIRSFDLRSSTEQGEKYRCEAILKASDFAEVDRVECQFTTTPTIFNNGSQIGQTDEPKKASMGFFDTIKAFWRNLWDFVTNFITGKSCSWNKCSSLFDISCHFQYICIGWIVMIFLVLASIPIGAMVLGLLHQKGFFDPVYDLFGADTYEYERARPRHRKGGHHHHHHHHHHQRHSHHHCDHHHSHRHHHAHQWSGNEPSHHHVLHRRGGEQWEVTAAEAHRQHWHDPALGVQHWAGGAGHKHRHGKAAAAAALHLEDPVEFREWRQDEARYAQHGLHGRDRRR